VEDLNEQDNKQKTTIKQLMQREQSRKDFDKIMHVLKPIQSSRVKYLDIPDETKEERENNKKTKIKR
jgi:hypothetical protein